MSALMVASGTGQKDTVAVLLEYGAQLNLVAVVRMGLGGDTASLNKNPVSSVNDL